MTQINTITDMSAYIRQTGIPLYVPQVGALGYRMYMTDTARSINTLRQTVDTYSHVTPNAAASQWRRAVEAVDRAEGLIFGTLASTIRMNMYGLCNVKLIPIEYAQPAAPLSFPMRKGDTQLHAIIDRAIYDARDALSAINEQLARMYERAECAAQGDENVINALQLYHFYGLFSIIVFMFICCGVYFAFEMCCTHAVVYDYVC
jgi:hypothetical protein